MLTASHRSVAFFCWVFPPRRPEAAEALMGTQQHDCRFTVITDAEATAAATRLQMRRRNGPRLPKRSWACSGTPAQRKAASKACRSKLPNIKYLAGDKSKLKAIKTWGVNHAAALV